MAEHWYFMYKPKVAEVKEVEGDYKNNGIEDDDDLGFFQHVKKPKNNPMKNNGFVKKTKGKFQINDNGLISRQK